jgi:hypothetical protein
MELKNQNRFNFYINQIDFLWKADGKELNKTRNKNKGRSEPKYKKEKKKI